MTRGVSKGDQRPTSHILTQGRYNSFRRDRGPENRGLSDSRCSTQTVDHQTPGVRQNLDELLTRLGKQIFLLSDKITQNYLTHVQASRQLATLENGGLP